MPGIQPVGFEHWPYRTRIAHRGAGRLAPENTLAAMRVGASHGYRMFEFDARLSGDGTVVLMHDDTLDRTTDGSGPMADQRFCERQSFACANHVDALCRISFAELNSRISHSIT